MRLFPGRRSRRSAAISQICASLEGATLRVGKTGWWKWNGWLSMGAGA
jgi:hypothetical protein